MILDKRNNINRSEISKVPKYANSCDILIRFDKANNG